MPAHYERLSYLDNSFLALEARTTHMHVAGIAIFDAGSLQRADGGVATEHIRAFVESKLHLIPRYRQRLAWVPMEQHPVWVDDASFNIEYHVRHYSLPRPGSFDQLRALVGLIMSQQLDRTRPLWELNVVEGLEGDRFAIVSKIHHCMIDGMAGVDLMAVLLNLAPNDEVDDPVQFVPRRIPADSELLIRETARRTSRALGAVRSVRQLGEDTRGLFDKGAQRARAAGYSLASGWLTKASSTPLNGKIGSSRLFGTMKTPLREVKDVKDAAGGSVNDVVLATVAGGVRRFLAESRGFDVSDLDFRAMAPVSVRSFDQRGTLGNHVAMWLVSLPVSQPDPLEQLEQVQKASQGDRSSTGGGDARQVVGRGTGDTRIDGESAGGRSAPVQHDRYQRPRSSVPALPPRGGDARVIRPGPVVASARGRGRPVLICRNCVLGIQRRLRRCSRCRRVRAGDGSRVP